MQNQIPAAFDDEEFTVHGSQALDRSQLLELLGVLHARLDGYKTSLGKAHDDLDYYDTLEEQAQRKGTQIRWIQTRLARLKESRRAKADGVRQRQEAGKQDKIDLFNETFVQHARGRLDKDTFVALCKSASETTNAVWNSKRNTS